MGSRYVTALLASFILAAMLSGCGGGDSPSTPSANEPTVTISATGVSPTQVRIAVGGRVNFVNNDIRPHAMSSDPITTHTDCPAINDVGTLTPGQQRSTGTLDVARTCGFHDHTDENNTAFKGTVVIQ
jgi:plastocyanin